MDCDGPNGACLEITTELGQKQLNSKYFATYRQKVRVFCDLLTFAIFSLMAHISTK